MIAVCLLTCGHAGGRGELTERTVESFEQHNQGRPDLIRLHADCGLTWASTDWVEGRGYVSVHEKREGLHVPQMVSFRQLVEAAALKGAEFVLWLENDWESAAPIPSIEVLRAGRDGPLKVVQWRMFGKRKMQKDGPRALAGEHRIGTKEKISWKPAPGWKGWEFGFAHWGAGGTIATLDFLEEQLFRNRLKDVITSKNDLPTLRTVSNRLWHIGDVTTEGFRG